jgi:hypothetical protein
MRVDFSSGDLRVSTPIGQTIAELTLSAGHGEAALAAVLEDERSNYERVPGAGLFQTIER